MQQVRKYSNHKHIPDPQKFGVGQSDPELRSGNFACKSGAEHGLTLVMLELVHRSEL